MRRLFVTTLIITAALAAVPSLAAAKGVREAQVCGAAGCRDVETGNLFAFLPDGGSAEPPSAAAPFVTVTVWMEHDGAGAGGFTYDYVPSAGLTRTHDGTTLGEWTRVSATSRGALDEAIGATQLKPAAELEGVQVPAPAQPPAAAPTTDDGGPPWWALAGATLAAVALLALLARYATSALKARPRASKSAN